MKFTTDEIVQLQKNGALTDSLIEYHYGSLQEFIRSLIEKIQALERAVEDLEEETGVIHLDSYEV